jgi:hypothetical protein
VPLPVITHLRVMKFSLPTFGRKPINLVFKNILKQFNISKQDSQVIQVKKLDSAFCLLKMNILKVEIIFKVYYHNEFEPYKNG